MSRSNAIIMRPIFLNTLPVALLDILLLARVDHR
jgi:hypothetical protein